MIVAVDFDGVLCDDRFPEIGQPNTENITVVKRMIEAGFEVILWTCRCDNELTKAVEWCKEWGLNFCAVNENAPSNIAKYKDMYPNGTRKVYADVYIDDHNLGCFYNKELVSFMQKCREEIREGEHEYVA